MYHKKSTLRRYVKQQLQSKVGRVTSKARKLAKYNLIVRRQSLINLPVSKRLKANEGYALTNSISEGKRLIDSLQSVRSGLSSALVKGFISSRSKLKLSGLTSKVYRLSLTSEEVLSNNRKRLKAAKDLIYAKVKSPMEGLRQGLHRRTIRLHNVLAYKDPFFKGTNLTRFVKPARHLPMLNPQRAVKPGINEQLIKVRAY